jgi:hypothetical protein
VSGPIERLRLGSHGPLVHAALIHPVMVHASTRHPLPLVIDGLAGHFGAPSVTASSLMADQRAPLGLGPLTADAMGLDYADETTRDLTLVRAVPALQRGRASATLGAQLRTTSHGTDLDGRLILSPDCRFGTELAIGFLLFATLWAIAETWVGAAVLALFAIVCMLVSWYAAAGAANRLLTDLSDVFGDELVVRRR